MSIDTLQKKWLSKGILLEGDTITEAIKIRHEEGHRDTLLIVELLEGGYSWTIPEDNDAFPLERGKREVMDTEGGAKDQALYYTLAEGYSVV